MWKSMPSFIRKILLISLIVHAGSFLIFQFTGEIPIVVKIIVICALYIGFVPNAVVTVGGLLWALYDHRDVIDWSPTRMTCASVLFSISLPIVLVGVLGVTLCYVGIVGATPCVPSGESLEVGVAVAVLFLVQGAWLVAELHLYRKVRAQDLPPS